MLIVSETDSCSTHFPDIFHIFLVVLGEESITYSPEQYAVVQAAQVITAGNYLAVIVTPEAAALAEQFNAALKG